MSISMIMGLVGPIAVKVLSSLWERVWSHGASTLQGTVAGAGVITLLQSMGCDMSLGSQAVLGAIAAAPGLLGTDPSKVSGSLFAAAAERIEQEKKSRAVLDAANAEQAAAATTAGIK